MVPPPTSETRIHAAMSMPQRRGQLLRLLDVALQSFNKQFDDFLSRLYDALVAESEKAVDSKLAHLYFNASNLLNGNRYVFFHVASSRIETNLRQAIAALDPNYSDKRALQDSNLSLVPFAEMDNKVMLGAAARRFETDLEEPLNALTIRLAFLVGRDPPSLAHNPFRPEIWLDGLQASWSEFDPDTATHSLILPLLTPDIFFLLRSLFDELNQVLTSAGVLPELNNAYQIRKSDDNLHAASNTLRDKQIRQKLRDLFARDTEPDQSRGHSTATKLPTDDPTLLTMQVDSTLLAYVSKLATRLPAEIGTPTRLSDFKQQLPAGVMRRIDETTIDLLGHVFDSIFAHQLIPNEIKNLIGMLQMPMLKTALQDKEFFCSEAHPARKLIALLSRIGLDWQQTADADDPLYQNIKSTVERAQMQQSNDVESDGFGQAVHALETYLNEAERASSIALAIPITQATRHEKIHFATRAAKNDIAERISAGDVAAFIETFLEHRWINVLTLAHTVEAEKPDILRSAIKTMDDLLWSVRPKVTALERKELITRLPTILGMLNKWLDVTKWADAERLQFFADLAEAHASIVRAPLNLSAERQLEIAVESAAKSAQRRAVWQAATVDNAPSDEYANQVSQLQRGTWIELKSEGNERSRAKLAWVSPLRSIYIFSAGQRRESFSVSAEELATKLRDGSARLLQIDSIVDDALAGAIENLNDISSEVT